VQSVRRKDSIVKNRTSTFVGALALVGIAVGSGAAEPAGEVRRSRPPSIAEPQHETTTQNPSEALQRPYEPATGLDHGSVGGTVDHAAPGAEARTGKPHDVPPDAERP
jgi:hypothetical protein